MMTINTRLLRNIAIALLSLVLLVIYIIWRQWQIRGSIENIGWPTSMVASEPRRCVYADQPATARHGDVG
jgi:hypothetical protein